MPGSKGSTDSPEFFAIYFGLPVLLDSSERGSCPGRIELGVETTLWVGDCIDEHGREWAPGGKLVRRRPDEVRGAYRSFPFELTGSPAHGRMRVWKDGGRGCSWSSPPRHAGVDGETS